MDKYPRDHPFVWKAIKLLEAESVVERGIGIFILSLIAGEIEGFAETQVQALFWYNVVHCQFVQTDRFVPEVVQSQFMLDGLYKRRPLESFWDAPSENLKLIRESLESEVFSKDVWEKLIDNFLAMQIGKEKWEYLGSLADFAKVLTIDLSEQNREFLKMAIESDDTSLRRMARWALDPKQPAEILALDPKQRTEVFDVLKQSIQDADAKTRRIAIQNLGKMDDERVIDVITIGLDDPSPTVRLITVLTLEQIATPKALEVLGQALQSEDKSLRIDAAKALSRIDDVQASDLLQNALQHEADADVSNVLAESIENRENPEQGFLYSLKKAFASIFEAKR